MKPIKQLQRLIQINHILAKNGLDQVIVSLHLFTPLRFMAYLNPWNWFRRNQLPRGVALRKTLEELGPIFIKFGQALSTRPDILPPDIALELCKLQDNVPPFPSEDAVAIIEETYGAPIKNIFAHFDMNVLAAASIAQVYSATLKSGEDVVVKILRPNIRKNIEKDLAILNTIANLADRYWSESKRFKPKEIVKEFEHSLYCELNLQREAGNGAQLRRNFNRSPLLYVPEIYWDYVRENILVMERIYGIPISDVSRLKEHGIHLKELAERSVELFFTQVLRDCFFHADMHPGNIFVSFDHPNEPQYICIDFGIIGTLNDNDKRYLAENLFAFFNRDYKRVALLHIESGWVANNTRVEEFESDIRTVCEPIFEKPLKDMSFALLMLQLFQVARRYQMVVQPQLVLLQKTLLAVEGLGRQLYPELDLWATAKPFLEKWMHEQKGPKALLKHVRENIPFLVEQLPYMPRLIQDVLILQKQLQITQLEQKRNREISSDTETPWYGGFGVGIFLSMAFLGALNYVHRINHGTLTSLTLSIAMIGGIVAFIHRAKR